MLQIMQVSGSGSFVFFLPLPFPLPLDVSDFFVAVFFFLAASDPSFVTFSDLRVLVTAAIFILLGETRADYSGNRCCRVQRVLRVIKAQVYLPRNASRLQNRLPPQRTTREFWPCRQEPA